MISLIELSLISYFAGSVNFSILLFKLLGKGDPRSNFSSNAGTTNVYRQAGLFWAIIVLILDLSRAVGIAALSLYMAPKEYAPIIGFFLILGNRFPCFHSFKGGKGVANYLGFTAYLTPLTGIISALVWVMAYGIVRKPFMASFFMISALAAGTIYNFSNHPVSIAGTSATTLFIFYNHKKNVIKLREERRSSKEE